MPKVRKQATGFYRPKRGRHGDGGSSRPEGSQHASPIANISDQQNSDNTLEDPNQINVADHTYALPAPDSDHAESPQMTSHLAEIPCPTADVPSDGAASEKLPVPEVPPLIWNVPGVASCIVSPCDDGRDRDKTTCVNADGLVEPLAVTETVSCVESGESSCSVEANIPVPAHTNTTILPESGVNPNEDTFVDVSILIEKRPILPKAVNFIKCNIPKNWICVPSESGFTVLLLCVDREPAVQRRLSVGVDGKVEISVHRRPLNEHIFEEVISTSPPVPFTDATWEEFSKRVILLVRRVSSYVVCAGADNTKYKDLWQLCGTGFIDTNPYGESRYSETCRSNSCIFLVNSKKWRCAECQKIKENFRKKRASHQGSEYKSHTANIHLDEAQKLAKLKDQRHQIKVKQNTIDRVTKKMNTLIEKEGVTVDTELHTLILEELEKAESTPGSRFEKFNPLQKLFFKEQIKASKVKGPSGVKWHPSTIRVALLLRSLSKTAYNALAGTGMIKLPSERTLYEYSHVLPAKEGCQKDKLDKIEEKLKKFEHLYQLYHVLIFDEMHISKNLVYLKSTGELVGYVDLSDVEQELRDIELFLNDDVNVNPPIATQMLTFMIKGTANSIKETVATFTTSKLNQCELYSRFWSVMTELEKRGIRIIASVCDGSSVNRAFIKMHVPFSKLPSKLVFDTINLCADGRILYFLSDVPHLIKTARNCFCKSGYGPSHSRLLTLNNETIVWQTIRNMYNGEREKNWRRCRKLNGQNVNLNSYSCMKVSYAAEVLSNTVATDLELMKWDGTAETVRFIRWFNEFFDMLNGAYSFHHVRTKNANLAPYCSTDDPRFHKLFEFLKYLNDWQVQVDSLQGYTRSQKQKMLLSRETLEGIEITIRGFTGATKFLLSEGTQFVNARVFCQDPLEQYHSKQRACVGGSSNPNVQQFLHSDVKIGVLREVSDVTVRYRRGNVKNPNEIVQVSDEPLPKRKKQ